MWRNKKYRLTDCFKPMAIKQYRGFGIVNKILFAGSTYSSERVEV